MEVINLIKEMKQYDKKYSKKQQKDSRMSSVKKRSDVTHSRKQFLNLTNFIHTEPSAQHDHENVLLYGYFG